MAGYTYKKGYWETKDHKMVRIVDMDTFHIWNIIRLLKRNRHFYDEFYGCTGFGTDEFYYDYENNEDLVQDKINELEHELRIRQIEEEVFEHGYKDFYR